MVAAGTVLRPQEVAIGALVQARDPGGFWYNAKIIKKTHASATVRYIGFGPGQDEAFYAKQAAIRTRLPAAELKVESPHISRRLICADVSRMQSVGPPSPSAFGSL